MSKVRVVRNPRRTHVASVCMLMLVMSPIAAGGPPGDDDGPPAAPRTLRDVDLTGFAPIFDGRTLAGWEGDPVYWRVEHGCMVGEVTPATLLKRNSWIVWRGGVVEDFELLIDYRISEAGNSGIGYRCVELAGEPFAVRGSQADIDGGNNWTGIHYEERGRTFLAMRGQKTMVEPGRMPRLVSQFADPAALQGIVRKNDWNRYHLIVVGPRARHVLNGHLMSDVIDRDEANRLRAGLLGMQVHVGPPMKVEFRNILLKRLTATSGEAGRGQAAAPPVHLLTFDNPATLAHLTQQAQRLTAPAPTAPLDGQVELHIVSKPHFAGHGLANIALIGASSPAPQRDSAVDLVLINGPRTVRVPGIPPDLTAGLDLERSYRFTLRWQATAYRIESFVPVD